MRYANIYADGFLNNDIFNPDSPRNRDNCLSPWRQLRNDLLKSGIELNTADINHQKNTFLDIYFDGQEINNNSNKKILIAIENPVINPLNKDIDYLKKFDYVFSWNSWALSIDKAIKIYFPTDINLKSPKFLNYRERIFFSCMINANKRLPIRDANDLYDERIRIIRWFEKNQPNDFYLFGMGWNKPRPAYAAKDKIFRRMERLLSQTFNKMPFPSWKGEVKDKYDVLSNSKFTFCYENSKNLENYVTEKIIDCFIAGSVPIYLGANNVSSLIPKKCYIDSREFINIEDIYSYIKKMPEAEYKIFQENIYDFILSKDIEKFGADFFSKKVCSVIQ